MEDQVRAIRATAAWAERASRRGWWAVTGILVRQIRDNRTFSELFPRAPCARDLLRPEEKGIELSEWAHRAFLTLERFHEEPGRNPGTQPAQLRAGTWGGPEAWQTQWLPEANDLYVRPIVTWTELQTWTVAAFHHSLERWVQRMRWFGEDRETEGGYQADLERFLFDDGVEMENIHREAVTSGGRVDFLLQGEILVTVELKVWRGERDNRRLGPARAPFQAAEYQRDFRLRRGYLVVVVPTDASHDLELPHCGQTVDGRELQLRVATVRPGPPSRLGRPRVLLTLDHLGLIEP